MTEAILFDLDGTLLPMDTDRFANTYLGLLARTMKPHGYEDSKAMISNVWKSVGAMQNNDGSRKNEQVFWDTFGTLHGKDVRDQIPLFESFYRNEFNQCAMTCQKQPLAKEAVELARKKGLKVILATNPIFPAVATEQRIRWAGLEPEDFDCITTYENSSSCKPSPLYFHELLEKLDLAPENCLMIGNDLIEDGAALEEGIPLYVVTDCLLNKDHGNLESLPHGSFSDLMQYLEELEPADHQ